MRSRPTTIAKKATEYGAIRAGQEAVEEEAAKHIDANEEFGDAATSVRRCCILSGDRRGCERKGNESDKVKGKGDDHPSQHRHEP